MTVSHTQSGRADATPDRSDATSGRITRHRLADRLFHWIMAVTVLTLLGTGFLPILGYRFDWVTIHWIAGLVLTALTLFHIVRASIWQWLSAMVPGPRDAAEMWRTFRRATRSTDAPPIRQGKYSVAQKLYHLAIAVVILAVTVTGLLMLAKIDTPLWQRNPYFLSTYDWGIVYVVHGYASMGLITLIIIHVYFAIRPEKLFFTRSMIVGWITPREYRETFDPERWPLDEDRTAGREQPVGARGPAE